MLTTTYRDGYPVFTVFMKIGEMLGMPCGWEEGGGGGAKEGTKLGAWESIGKDIFDAVFGLCLIFPKNKEGGCVVSI